jgi:hypothetical protein
MTAWNGGDAEKKNPYNHDARPSDDAEPGDHCKDCGEGITWMGPTAVESITDPGYHVDWLHSNDPRN